MCLRHREWKLGTRPMLFHAFPFRDLRLARQSYLTVEIARRRRGKAAATRGWTDRAERALEEELLTAEGSMPPNPRLQRTRSALLRSQADDFELRSCFISQKALDNEPAFRTRVKLGDAAAELV